MIKGSALYIVIVISLIIAIISASLLTIAFYYRMEVRKKSRLDKLLINMESGTAMLLSSGFTKYGEDQLIDLFGTEQDSIMLKKEQWGAYELGVVKAFESTDTIKRAFFAGNAFLDSQAIYLADEDRPLSLSGNTQITGDGGLPKSGLKKSYVDGKPYAGKEVINGKIFDSTRDVPPLNEKLLAEIIKRLKPEEGLFTSLKDSMGNSFFNPVQIYKLDKNQLNIGARKIKGKIILVSDTTVTIDAESNLDNIQLYAHAIIVAPGFRGTCQLFARDSIIIGKDATFNYPSFAGVFKSEDGKIQSKISLAEGVSFSGILLSYEKKRSDLQTMISLGKNCKINGEVFATGYVKMEKEVSVYGKVSAKRFLMQMKSSLYENYLIDVVLNRKLLSKYYLSSPVFKTDQQVQKVLTWLN